MGSGIAESASLAGFPVIVCELPDFTLASRDRLEKSMAAAVQRGKLAPDQRAAALARVTFTSELNDVADSDLVIEAVPENRESKTSIMTKLNEIVSREVVLASNTSSIPIGELASVVSKPARVLGLHFFSPVPVIRLVEIVRALDTGDETIAEAETFVARLGKRSIECKDRAGFIVNFLLTPYLMGAVRMYEEGFATRDDIDAGMKLGANHPMGPLELCDFIGLDVLQAVSESLFDEFRRDEYAPPPLMKRMIAAGRLGRKSGRGFYEYPR